MSYENILGLVIGVGVLATAAGYLVDIYRHPERFFWLDLTSPHETERPSVPFMTDCHRHRDGV